MVAMHADVKGMLLVRLTVRVFKAHAVRDRVGEGGECGEECVSIWQHSTEFEGSMAHTGHAQQWNIG